MSDEHSEEAVEPEVEAAAAVDEVSDEALDDVAGGFAAAYVKPPEASL